MDELVLAAVAVAAFTAASTYYAGIMAGRLGKIEKELKGYRTQFSMTFTPMEDRERGYMSWPKWSEQHLSQIVTLLEHIALAQGLSPEKIKELRDRGYGGNA